MIFQLVFDFITQYMMFGSAAALPNHFLHTSNILVDISSIILFKNKGKIGLQDQVQLNRTEYILLSLLGVTCFVLFCFYYQHQASIKDSFFILHCPQAIIILSFCDALHQRWSSLYSLGRVEALEWVRTEKMTRQSSSLSERRQERKSQHHLSKLTTQRENNRS